MGCSPRSVNISFLSSLKTGPFFKVTNLEDGNVLRASRSEAYVSFEAHCSSGVERLEIEDPPLDITTHVHDLKRRCTDDGKIIFDLPTSLFHDFSMTAPGEFYQNISLRALGADPIRREPIEHTEHLRVRYSPPHNSIMLPNFVNIRATDEENFKISGRCEEATDFIKISGAFEGSPQVVACRGATYEKNVKVIAATGENTVSFTLESRGAPSARTYMEITVPVSVDLQAPELEITSPVAGAIYNKSATEVGPLKVAGTCSEEQRDVTVQIWSGSVLQKQGKVSCSSNEFEFSAPWSEFSDGVLKIQVEQTDLAENKGGAELNIEKRVQAPGVFTVSGVTSGGPGDVDIDNTLKDLMPVIHFTESQRAVLYTIDIFLSTGGDSICTKEASVLSAALPSCQLANSSEYIARVKSKDVYGNTRVAPDFAFTTSYVGAKITSVETTTAADSILTKDQVIEFTVKVDRPVKVLNLSSNLTLLMPSEASGSAKAILVTPLNSVVSSLTYRYVVPVNVYSSHLKVQNIIIGSAIADSVTEVVLSGTINPESGGNAYSITAKNIVIDSTPPNPPEVFYIVSPKIATFSNIDYVAHNDGSGATTYLRMTNMDTSESTTWRTGVNGSYQFESPTAGLGLGVSYRIEAYTEDNAGNSSATTIKDFKSFSCPAQFAYVWDGIESPFCVAKFEGKGTEAAPLIAAAGIPTLFSNVTTAKSYCEAFGAKYGIINNSQWQVLANLVVRQPKNWTGNNYLDGALRVGNVAGVHGNSEGVDIEFPSSPNVGGLYSRKLLLPYNQEVWDLSGNASEIVIKDETAPFHLSPITPVELLLGDLKQSYGARGIDCHNVHLENPMDGSPEVRCGFGSVSNSGSTYFMYRGGDAKSSNMEAGVFTALENPGVFGGAAARCVFNP